MYLINAVYSEGLDGGRHTVPFAGNDKYAVVVEAFESYKAEVDVAVMEDDIDSAVVGFEEFFKAMEDGFNGGADLVLIQRNDSHIQYEGSYHQI